MENVLDVLHERGFIQDISDEDILRTRLKEPITLYNGYDATADSLHIGHLVTIMMLAWFQRFGHRPIALVGGGTTLIGDPSGRQSSRPILSTEEIERNVQSIKGQIGRFLDFSDGKALLVNNADWLTNLNFVEFMRDIGERFSVNEVLRLEAYRTRLEAGGMTFLELCYAVMQPYDFLRLYEDYGCILQTGGSDQWGNSIMGADLVRRVTGGQAFVIVAPLIATSEGRKMGKSEAGAIWLSADRLSPYDYYQWWRNTPDADVETFLSVFTFLPMQEIRNLVRLHGAEMNHAKEILAIEATTILHGEDAAREAQNAARALFDGTGSDDNVPTVEIDRTLLAEGIPITHLFKDAGLVKSANEARTLINQGGLSIDGAPVTDPHARVSLADMPAGQLMLRAGKKKHMRVVVSREP